MRQIIFEGPTKLGHRTIREGDLVEFFGGRHKGAAFFSQVYTPLRQQSNEITCRIKDYGYGADPENCHSWSARELTCHIVTEKSRSGFGKWIKEHDDNCKNGVV